MLNSIYHIESKADIFIYLVNIFQYCVFFLVLKHSIMHEQAYVCICMYMYAYASTCVFEYACVYLCVQICVCVFVFMNMFLFACFTNYNRPIVCY